MGTYEKTMVKLEKMAQATNAQQMNWQKSMSDTSHQREVKDLVAAGLNPVLSSGGQGAQSYSTSLDSAASAVGNLASAHEGASATRYAARQSAAATRAAAAANLAAAREAAAASRYAADRGYSSSKYASDTQERINKYTVDNQLVNNPWAAVDKVTRNLGLQDATKSSRIMVNAVKGARRLLDGDIKGIVKDFNKNAPVGWSMLKKDGKIAVNTFINKLGLQKSDYVRKAATAVIFNNNQYFLKELLKLVDNKNTPKKSTSAKSYSVSNAKVRFVR